MLTDPEASNQTAASGSDRSVGSTAPATDLAARLRQAIDGRTARVGVIGLGYVGLPLIELFVGARFPVLGFDIDPVKVDHLQAGRSYIGHIESRRIAEMRECGRFEATVDFSRLVEADAILICVPTPLGAHREPDLSAVIGTGRAIGRYLRPGQLVVLESTKNVRNQRLAASMKASFLYSIG